MTAFTDTQVEMVFRMLPELSRRRLLELRELVFDFSSKLGLENTHIEETLKSGEPSYLSPKGSTIRVGWNVKDPDFYRLFFHCQTSLIETFRTLFPHLEFEGNRVIRLSVAENIEVAALRKCIQLALTCHSVKHLPLLGSD